MTQIILNNILLPEVGFDQYACWEEPQEQTVDMVTRRRVAERIKSNAGEWKLWRVRWAYDYMTNGVLRPILAVLRSGGPIPAAVLPDDRDELVTATFLVDSLTEPTFLIDDNGTACWHGLAFSLREERPHA